MFVILSNLPPLLIIYKFSFDNNIYKYSIGDASFTVQDHLGKESSGIGTIKYGFSHFSQDHPTNKNKILYRLFWRNPLCFWRWGEYIFGDQYKLPYKNWYEIEKARVPYFPNSSTQDF